MNFFSKAFGFAEANYNATRSALASAVHTVERDPLGPDDSWQRVIFNPPGHQRGRRSSAEVPAAPASAAGADAAAVSKAAATSAAGGQHAGGGGGGGAAAVVGGVHAGTFRFDSVAELRATALRMLRDAGYGAVAFEKAHVEGDSRALHGQYGGAMFQAASQFNALEFVGPSVVPENGIECYINDRTQGPACAIACAAATAVRNYLLPVTPAGLLAAEGMPSGAGFGAIAESDGIAGFGQTAGRQLNGLASVEAQLFAGGTPLWRVRNGYIELTNAGADGLPHLAGELQRDPARLRRLLDEVRVGAVFDAEVTDKRGGGGDALPFLVSQIFASACSIGYSRRPAEQWEAIARIALRGAYEATFAAYVIHALRLERSGRAPGPLLLTKLGGGVFANPAEWICDAMIGAQQSTQALFDEAAKQTGAGGAVRPPFRLPVLVTHFRGVEPGYDRFVASP